MNKKTVLNTVFGVLLAAIVLLGLTFRFSPTGDLRDRFLDMVSQPDSVFHYIARVFDMTPAETTPPETTPPETEPPTEATTEPTAAPVIPEYSGTGETPQLPVEGGFDTDPDEVPSQPGPGMPITPQDVLPSDKLVG